MSNFLFFSSTCPAPTEFEFSTKLKASDKKPSVSKRKGSTFSLQSATQVITRTCRLPNRFPTSTWWSAATPTHFSGMVTSSTHSLMNFSSLSHRVLSSLDEFIFINYPTKCFVCASLNGGPLSGPAPSSEEPTGSYPTLVKQPSGRSVPVVQAFAFGKYLGNLMMTFNDDGEVIATAGLPILMDKSVPRG